ncbi:MAG TPA: flagellar hook-associated protein FlgL [Stellaceae bacterium]|jgi:flagellar hook-associated protein 3 FlgL|nr:flagellar hook-associated protein FlgL [Stellaceae bacterium]
MRISTNEFLLGSVNDLLAQQQNVNLLNREIATGETMLDASSDPGGAGQVIGLANQIGTLSYDTANGQAAAQMLQTGVSALQQVTTLLDQLRQTATAAANGTTTPGDRQSYISSAQTLAQQLVQLANTQNANGSYLFAGTHSNAQAFTTQSNGQVVFNGDAGTNQVQIAPSLDIGSTISGQNVFMNVQAGTQGVAVSASGGNTGSAYALAQGITNISQVTAASLAGTQYDITFSAAGPGLEFQVTSGHGAPGSPGYIATEGVVASGSYTPGTALSFGGVQVQVTGTPAAGDSFAVQPGASTNVFQTVQDLISALNLPRNTPAESAQAQQALQNILTNLTGAQTSVLSAQATLGTSLAEIQSVQNQTSTQGANASTAMSNLQSANLPQVLANYSESLTALQAAQLAFAKVQNLSLFQDLTP